MYRPFRQFKTHVLFALSGLLLFQSLGWLTVWGLARQEARRHARAALEVTTLERITIELGTLEQLRVDKHEIRLNGRLYDIRSSTIHSDSVTLELYHDIREEQLYAVLGTLLSPVLLSPGAPLSGAPAQAFAWLFKWMQTVYLMPEGFGVPGQPEGRTISFFLYRIMLQQICLILPDQPPEI